MLANLVEHTRTIRLFPRPVVAVQNKSFLQSRNKVSTFIEEFCRTQVGALLIDALMKSKQAQIIAVKKAPKIKLLQILANKN